MQTLIPLNLFINQRLVWGANIWTTVSRARRASDLIVFLPVAAVVFFLSGAIIPWLPAWWWVWGPVAGLYGLLIAGETFRRAERPRDLPGLALALVIGNLGPGIGAVLGPLGLLPDQRRLYRNFE